ncbi:unnamed protein product [Rangifer tarandus platyrhynchus]|uniref:Uncharacterized protein n=2 Tax=Rangifer tarandus platyrhynchus TaxID=3082113 RepID=A0AC59ZI74_RANTA|nr:unnamed protein product [Rangifer tarandus platyrhynchus]
MLLVPCPWGLDPRPTRVDASTRVNLGSTRPNPQETEMVLGTGSAPFQAVRPRSSPQREGVPSWGGCVPLAWRLSLGGGPSSPEEQSGPRWLLWDPLPKLLLPLAAQPALGRI